MSLSSLDQLITAIASPSAQNLYFAKSGKSNQLTGGFSSSWNGSGSPGAGDPPGAAEIPSSATAGALAFVNPAGGLTEYFARVAVSSSVSGASMRLYDRIGHMGGLVGNSTAAQTVGLSMTGASNNLAARRGKSDYSEVQWYLEWYTDTGSTAVTATVSYTGAAGVSGQAVAISVPATQRAGRMLQIIADNGEAIRSIESVTLSASTGTAGDFGVTAARLVVETPSALANTTFVHDWAALGLPIVAADACIAIMYLNPGASGVTFTGSALLVAG